LIVEQGSRLEQLPLGEAHRIAAGSTAWRINAGDRIRVSVSLSSWPRLEVALQERILRVDHSAPYECAVLLPRLEVS
jgi:predicted acyl esterase